MVITEHTWVCDGRPIQHTSTILDKGQEGVVRQLMLARARYNRPQFRCTAVLPSGRRCCATVRELPPKKIEVPWEQKGIPL